MTIEETKQVINKIKAFRPFFQTGNSSREENEFKLTWHEILEPYDYVDVENKLIEYFKDPENIGKIPDVFYITKYLKSHNEKHQSQGIWLRCPLCQKELAQSLFEDHYDRCSSVNYIYNKTKEYFGQTLDKEKLFNMSKNEFDTKYLNFIKALKEKARDIEEKNRLEKIAKMLNGEKVDLTLKEMM